MNVQLQPPEIAISQLLRRIILAPCSQVSKIFSVFEKNFENRSIAWGSVKMTPELSERILHATEKLHRMEDVPEHLQNLILKLNACLQDSLIQSYSVLSSNLKDLMGNSNIETSFINNYISIFSGTKVSLSDLIGLIGSDWGVDFGGSLHEIDMNYHHGMNTFYQAIYYATEMNQAIQAGLWSKYHLSTECANLANSIEDAKASKIEIPNTLTLEKLKESGRSCYIPIGYANTAVFFISLIALNYDESGWRLRLLSADRSLILAAGNKQRHYCPEVIWEGLSIDQLTQASLWKPLLEVATLNEQELLGINEKDRGCFLAFNPTHLVPYLIRKLGKFPLVRHAEIGKDDWDYTEKNKYPDRSFIFTNFNTTPVNDLQKDLLLKPTGKEVKHVVYNEHMRKFINLIPIDLLPTREDVLLFKAESRLMLLAGSYIALRDHDCTPVQRGHFLRIIEKSFGKSHPQLKV